MIIGIIILALIVIVGLYIYSTQRNLVDLDEKANNAISQIAVQLNTRWDAVTALVKLTEQYAAHHKLLKYRGQDRYRDKAHYYNRRVRRRRIRRRLRRAEARKRQKIG